MTTYVTEDDLSVVTARASALGKAQNARLTTLEAGATYRKYDYTDGPWTKFFGAGSISGRVITGAWTGDGTSAATPYDGTSLYRVTFDLTRLAGTGGVFLGLNGVKDDGTRVATDGSATATLVQFTAAAGAYHAGRHVYVGYVRGFTSANSSGTFVNPGAPGAIRSPATKIAPVVWTTNAADSIQINAVYIERLPDATAYGTPWIYPTALANGWVAYGGTSYGGAFGYRINAGCLELAGMVKNGTSQIIYTLPTEVRPQWFRTAFGVGNAGGVDEACRIIVTKTGEVRANPLNPANAIPTWVSLDSVRVSLD